MAVKKDTLRLSSKEFHSRLIVGTGKYSSLKLMKKCHEVSGTEMVTIAIRRIPLKCESKKKNILDYIDTKKITLLPNTSGISTAEEARRLAKIVVQLGLRFLKIEVINDVKSLLPEPIETFRAVELIRREFSSEELFLMVYTNDDPALAKKLVQAGADCIMPGGSPIGSGRGIENMRNMYMILDIFSGKIPIILDAGVGSPADVILAMEMGFDAVLLNSAISGAKIPLKMAEAMKYACLSGRYSYYGGRIPKKLYASASSPLMEYRLI